MYKIEEIIESIKKEIDRYGKFLKTCEENIEKLSKILSSLDDDFEKDTCKEMILKAKQEKQELINKILFQEFQLKEKLAKQKIKDLLQTL